MPLRWSTLCVQTWWLQGTSFALYICVNVRSDITWFQPRKCMSSNLYKGMTLLPQKNGDRFFLHEFQTSIRMNEIWNHAIPIVHLRGCRASKESPRHHPCLERRPNWGPPLLETGQCPDQEDPLRESHCWSASGSGWREGEYPQRWLI